MSIKNHIAPFRIASLIAALLLSIFAITYETTFPIIVAESPNPTGEIAKIIPYLAPIAWAVFFFTLIWKGKVRRIWQEKGHDYDLFRLIAKMRGSNSRILILRNLSVVPKNKLQLANELELDWKTVSGHIEMLLEHNLVKETINFWHLSVFHNNRQRERSAATC